MAVKKSKKVQTNKKQKTPFENRANLRKLFLYIAIVNAGQGEAIINLMQYIGSSAQYVQRAVGTAPSNLLSILNIADNKKEVVISFLKDTLLDDAQRELNAFFSASKRNAGVGFAIPLTSIMGVRIYKFLTRTV